MPWITIVLPFIGHKGGASCEIVLTIPCTTAGVTTPGLCSGSEQLRFLFCVEEGPAWLKIPPPGMVKNSRILVPAPGTSTCTLNRANV